MARNKVGILTYHNNLNVGAILQAYCVWKATNEEAAQADVEIIDYRTLTKELTRILSLSPSRVLSNIRNFSNWQNFYKENTNICEDSITTNNYNKAVSFIKKQGYDAIIVGSDEVWRLDPRPGITEFRRPFPNGHYLSPSINCRKVSYAASANLTDFSYVSESEKEQWIELIASFDNVSVRDEYTKNLLEQNGIYPRVVPDPTIIADIPTKDVRHKLVSNGIDLDRPILGIHASENEFVKSLTRHFRSRGYQIVSPGSYKSSDVNFLNKLSPFEYYNLYSNFDVVITSSFHSTIFSLKNTVPFISFDSYEGYTNKQSKIYSLLKSFNMLHRHFDITGDNSIQLKESEINELEKFDNETEIAKNMNKQKNIGRRFIAEEVSKYENSN